jgi:pre-rRNA-processing protein TSR1
VASCIGPISMCAQEPLLVLRAPDDSSTASQLQLVGRGALLSIDPDRIVLKKIVLTGNPIRVRKRSAVVRNMFYDPMDIKWFKPAELSTAHGLRGHIKCSVGTHGLYKALFSAPITQDDCVMLTLFKRVFPKIPEQDQLEPALEAETSKEGEDMED